MTGFLQVSRGSEVWIGRVSCRAGSGIFAVEIESGFVRIKNEPCCEKLEGCRTNIPRRGCETGVQREAYVRTADDEESLVFFGKVWMAGSCMPQANISSIALGVVSSFNLILNSSRGDIKPLPTLHLLSYLLLIHIDPADIDRVLLFLIWDITCVPPRI